MQFLRTLFWIALLIVVVILTVLNWETTLAMNIWPGFVWDTRLPAIIVVAFLLGMLPTWLIHRGTKWRLERRISHLEAAARATTPPRAVEAEAAKPETAPLSPAPGTTERPLP